MGTPQFDQIREPLWTHNSQFVLVFQHPRSQEAEAFPYPTEPKTCRIWRSQKKSGLDAPLSAYIEIKKTTHLNGLNGAYKLLNYWLQAALMKAGAVCVAFADDATGVVSHGQKFSLRQLEVEIQERFQDPDILSKVS